LPQHRGRDVDRDLGASDVIEERQELPRPGPDLRDRGPLFYTREGDDAHVIETSCSPIAERWRNPGELSSQGLAVFVY
jgi:hypothetical protein